MKPTYLARRLAYSLYEFTHPNEPWIAQKAVRFLKNNLSNDWIGLEWGSGRSSAWFAERLEFLVSIEHNKEWHEKISRSLPANAECRYISLNHPESESTHPDYNPLPDYVKVVHEFDRLNFVVVDGHYRQACVKAAMPKLSRGGLLLVDNTNWLPLVEWGVPTTWPIVHQSENVMTQTTIWRKP
jgi:hypothetical protein